MNLTLQILVEFILIANLHTLSRSTISVEENVSATANTSELNDAKSYEAASSTARVDIKETVVSYPAIGKRESSQPHQEETEPQVNSTSALQLQDFTNTTRFDDAALDIKQNATSILAKNKQKNNVSSNFITKFPYHTDPAINSQNTSVIITESGLDLAGNETQSLENSTIPITPIANQFENDTDFEVNQTDSEMSTESQESTEIPVHPHLVSHCYLYPTDARMYTVLADLLAEQAKLIEYDFSVVNYTINPLIVTDKSSGMYKSNRWSRVESGHGQTMISLVFNYQILSLMTLSFGVEKLHIELQDMPEGCASNLTDEERQLTVLDLLMRDLRPDEQLVVVQGEASICHQVVREVHNTAFFSDRCCARATDSMDIHCDDVYPNRWLDTLDVMLLGFVAAVFVFGVLVVPGWMYSSALDSVNYVVNLKEPFYKTMAVFKGEVTKGVFARHTLDLRNKEEFHICKRVANTLPTDMIIPIVIPRFNLKVNYRKLLTESYVPVSLVECLSKALFLCKLRDLDTFRDCCDASISGACITTNQHRSWISCCEVIGRMLLVFALPFPFYIRLYLYYAFEHQEVCDRHDMAESLGLRTYYNYRLMQYLTPTHPIYITAYALFFMVGLHIAYLGKNETRFQAAIVDSFADLKQMSWLRAMRMFVRNALYPFRRYGIFGAVVGLLIWPILMPLSAAVCFFYCLPIVFLSSRIAFHITKQVSGKKKMIFSETVEWFEAENLIRTLRHRDKRNRLTRKFHCYFNQKKCFVNVIATLITLLTIYSVLLMFAEVAGYLAEIVTFTMMGLIVNASKVIKYGSLIFLVVIYCVDTYSNVNKKYQKLNKALFSEIKSRIKGLNDLICQPSYLQINTGFKASEASEQAEHEHPDDLARRPYHWDINDLILFLDSEDIPRIPKLIFEQCCLIRVSGSPGPIYRSLLKASGRFVVIIFFLMFVFIVVMSFGDAYKVSSSNQMLATLAGGFMPFILSKMLKPVSSDVETNLVSYKSKLEEIIENFNQSWPMYDFPFNIVVAEETPSRIDLTNPLVDINDVKAFVDTVPLKPAGDQMVDVAILVSEQFLEWEYSMTDSSDSESIKNYATKNGQRQQLGVEMENLRNDGKEQQTNSV